MEPGSTGPMRLDLGHDGRSTLRSGLVPRLQHPRSVDLTRIQFKSMGSGRPGERERSVLARLEHFCDEEGLEPRLAGATRC